jgi:hypothetical protein
MDSEHTEGDSTLQRYDIYESFDWPKTDSGKWCCAEDVAKMEAKNEFLRAENERMRLTLNGILNANWREWDELASPDYFVEWAKSRAKHALEGGK